MPSKEEIEKAYWKGYIQKQNEVMEICKQCKYRKKVKLLETREQNLIKKLKEKDKIIDLMAEEIDTSDYCVPEDCPGIDCKDHVKEYYRKMAKEVNNE